MREKWSKKLTLFLVLIALAILGRVGYNAEAASKEFSADMVSRSGGETVRAKIYVAADKMRTEMSDNIMITRFDKNLVLVVMPSQRMYMEQPIDRKMVPQTAKKFEGEIERVPLGVETVDGKPAEKFKVTYTEGSKRVSVYQWIRDSEFPVKIEAVDGSWSVEYKNLSVGSQPNALFEPPAGFQKFSMPFSAGSGMPSR